MDEPSTAAAELIALAERVEGLTGPNGDLDGAIYAALNPHMRPIPGNQRRFYDPALTRLNAAREYHVAGATAYAPSFTASLDAALGLVPEGWLAGLDIGALRATSVWLATDSQSVRVHAPTPALALTAAALRARAAEIADGKAESTRAEAIRSAQAMLNEYRTDLEAAKAELGKGR